MPYQNAKWKEKPTLVTSPLMEKWVNTHLRKRNETYGIKVGVYRDASPLGF